jgi:hypothetical protein
LRKSGDTSRWPSGTRRRASGPGPPAYRFREPLLHTEVEPSVATNSALMERHDDVEKVAPAHPDAPGVPFPPVAEDAYDAELEAIADARHASSARVAFIARLFAIAASAALAFALRHDLRFALSSRTPIDLPATPTTAQLEGAAHRLVDIRGVPGGVGAVDYRRPIGNGLYRLAPLVDQPNVYVELRLPDGIDPTRYIPPTSLHGRLVPMDEGGARFSSARALIQSSTGRPAPAQTFILEEGAQPSLASPGAVIAMLALLLCIGQVAMMVRPRKSAAGPRPVAG